MVVRVSLRLSMPKISQLRDDPSSKSDQVSMKADASNCLPSGQGIPPHLLDPRLELWGIDAMPCPFLLILLRDPVTHSLTVLKIKVASAQRQGAPQWNNDAPLLRMAVGNRD
jgi:hypothetical protein